MTNRSLTLCLLGMSAIAFTACDDSNTSTLAALNMPGEMQLVERCTINGNLVGLNETDCAAQGGSFTQSVYTANIGTGTLSYIPYYPRRKEFEVIDITRSVPGVTSIPVGDMPQSLAADEFGAIVVLTSAIHNDTSIISVNDNREIAFQELDKPPRKVIYSKLDHAFYVFFLDGTLRRLRIQLNCGQVDNSLPAACKLSKDNITVTWENVMTMDGIPMDYVAHPTLPKGYVSYQDRRYISVLGWNDTAGACLDGTSQYPCEIERLGAGFACADGIDNNNDGLIDAQDPTCFYPWSSEGLDATKEQIGWLGIGECGDGIDNNGNDFIDALDPGCVASNDASEDPGFQPMTLGTCADGTDNDGDGDSDRDDVKCRWPSMDEDSSSEEMALSNGLCRDGIDNDGDGKSDLEDLACYGKNGFSEVDLVSKGRGAISIDPKGRWLYVLDPVDSQLIVIDLATGNTIDRSGWFPRQRVVGIPTSRLALDVASAIRTETEYDKNGHKVISERSVAFVSSTNGYVTEYLIGQTYTHYYNDVPVNSVDELAMRVTDTSDDSTYIGVIRCVGRICTDQDLPNIKLRTRPAVGYFPNSSTLSTTNPDTGEPHYVIYDTIMASETWRLTYEGTLERETRSDGYFSQTGIFNTNIDLCALGAQNGDHLVLRQRNVNTSFPQCRAFYEDADGKQPILEWEIVDVGPNSLQLKPISEDGYSQNLPAPECFSNGLEYEIRASHQWILTSNATFVNRRYTAGNHCIDNPLHPFGQTRFSISAEKTSMYDAETAFFSIQMPNNASTLARDSAFEFTTRTGLSTLSVGMASAPSSMIRFVTGDNQYLLISDANAHIIAIYNIDDESIEDTL